MTVREFYEMFRKEKSDIKKVRVTWNTHKVLVDDLRRLDLFSDIWDENVISFFVLKNVLYFEVN